MLDSDCRRALVSYDNFFLNRATVSRYGSNSLCPASIRRYRVNNSLNLHRIYKIPILEAATILLILQTAPHSHFESNTILVR